MSDVMTFPETVEEYMEEYKVVDTEKVYTGGIELVPIFRMKQWFEHLPTASHEMSAVEYLKARERLCYEQLSNNTCNGCPMLQCKGYDCETIEDNRPDEAVAIVEKWVREHPEERSINDER